MDSALARVATLLSAGAGQPMNEPGFWQSVEAAREQLSELRKRVGASGGELIWPEIASGLGSVQETLDKLQATCASLRDDVVRASDATAHADRLRAIALERLIADEDERRSLARELQNGLGQDIALAKLRLAALRHATSVELYEPLLGIERLVETADRSLRLVTFRISPLILYDLGVVPATEWLAEDLLERREITLWIADEGQVEPTGEAARMILFRVVRELVILAAGPSAIEHPVWLRHHGDGAELRITIESGRPWVDAGGAETHGAPFFELRQLLGHVRGRLRVNGARPTEVTLTAHIGG